MHRQQTLGPEANRHYLRYSTTEGENSLKLARASSLREHNLHHQERVSPTSRSSATLLNPAPVLQNTHQMPALESSPAGSPSPQGAISRDLQSHLVLIRSEKDAVG